MLEQHRHLVLWSSLTVALGLVTACGASPNADVGDGSTNNAADAATEQDASSSQGADAGTLSDDSGATASTDAGAATDAGSTGTTGTLPPSLAPLDAATQSHVRALLTAGAAAGNRSNVFAKIGDSITESASFLGDIGNGWFNLGSYSALRDTITTFSTVTFSDGSNSFDRGSVAAVGGWTTADALGNGNTGASPVQTELRTIHPAYAIIMLGTNDLDHWGVDTYIANMQTIVSQVEAEGVVPIVSTIPDRMDATAKDALVFQYNAAIRSMASSDHIPLIDYWAALQSLPNKGVNTDGIHPNIFTGPDGSPSGGYFTEAALQFGYNVRNLTAVQALDALRVMFP